MIAFILRRGFQAIWVMAVVSLVAFAMFRYVGDPVQMMLNEEQTPEARERLRAQLGLDDPVVVQFGRFAWGTARGDMGASYRSGMPASSLIAERLPATLELVLCAALLATLLGLPMGIYAAIHRRRAWSRVFQSVSLLGVSMPTFLTGILLMMLFSVKLQWLPAFGRGEVVQFGGWSTGFLTRTGLQSLILPSVTLALFQTALIMRLVRVEMLEALGSDFVKFARSRGLSERRVYLGHALRNALAPVVTVGGMQFGTLVAFSIVTEAVFQWPGVGLLFVQSVSYADTPVMAAYLMFVAVLFVGVNLAVDLIHLALDPRLRATGVIEEGASGAC